MAEAAGTDTEVEDADGEAKRIGATIRALREAHGFSVVGLAAAIGKSHAYVSNIEHGRKRAPRLLCRDIAAALGVPLGAIVSPGYQQDQQAKADV
jgi:transcriptional regulator with XRE-family HTH domain